MDNRMARKSVFQSLRIEKHGRTRRLGRCRIVIQSVAEAFVAGCSQCSRGCRVTNTARTYEVYRLQRLQGAPLSRRPTASSLEGVFAGPAVPAQLLIARYSQRLATITGTHVRERRLRAVTRS
jgi:hypothetical protein